jgi:hypothetical protein
MAGALRQRLRRDLLHQAQQLAGAVALRRQADASSLSPACKRMPPRLVVQQHLEMIDRRKFSMLILEVRASPCGLPVQFRSVSSSLQRLRFSQGPMRMQ